MSVFIPNIVRGALRHLRTCAEMADPVFFRCSIERRRGRIELTGTQEDLTALHELEEACLDLEERALIVGRANTINWEHPVMVELLSKNSASVVELAARRRPALP